MMRRQIAWPAGGQYEVGIDLNPFHIVEDVGGAVIDVIKAVGSGAGAVATYTADAVGDAAGAVAHVITHPLEVPGDILSIVAHPGLLVKPGFFIALVSGGAVGIAYAYALDKTGVTDLVAHAVDAAGGIYVTWIVKPFCAFAKLVGGFPGINFACLIVAVGYDVALAISNGDMGMLVDALKELVTFALQTGLDLNDVINSVMESVFRVMGADAEKIFGNLGVLQAGLNKLGLPGNDIVKQITKSAGDIQVRATQWAQQAVWKGVNTGFTTVKSAVAAKKAGTDPSVHLPYTTVNEYGGVDTILPIVPAALKRIAYTINSLVANPNSPGDRIVGQVQAALGMIRENQIEPFVHLLTMESIGVILGFRAHFRVPTPMSALFWGRLEHQTLWWVELLSFFGIDV